MPYENASDPKLPENIQAMSLDKRQVWVGAFNSSYAACIADGGEADTCESRAFAIATSAANRQKSVKARGDWELDVLGVPFGDPSTLDSDGQFFDSRTRLHGDKYPLPPVVYYHGMDANGRPSGEPQYIGKTVGFEDRPDGRWYHVVLDKTNEMARRVWEAAKQGIARASSGSIGHLARFAQDGHITEWPVAELSVFDAIGNRQPANQYAVALPRMKAIISEFPEFAEAEQDNGAESDNQPINQSNEVKTMENEQEKQAVDLTPVLDAIGNIGDAVKSIAARVEQLEQTPTNDPGVTKSAPAVIIADNTAKYDNVGLGDLAFAAGVLDAAKSNGRSRMGASADMKRAVAKRLESDIEANTEALKTARHAMKSSGIKANEINQSTLANYGDEWVGVAYSGQLWESIRHEAMILSKLPQMEVPQGAESVVIPLESTDPTWYKVAQAANLTSNPGGIPSNTVTASNVGTANQTLSLGKMGARIYWTGELEEDAVLPYVAQMRNQLATSGAEYLESAIIDGDTATGATVNINDIADTPGGTEYWLTVNGFRKLALVTNTANSRDAGALTSADFLETVKLMGVGGANAVDVTKVGFIIPYQVHYKALELPDVKTRDVFSGATIESGRLTGIFGYPIMTSYHMHKPQASRLANTAGNIDLNTAGNNTTSAILAVRWDQWMFGWRRRMTLETSRIPEADTTQIVALMRFGLVYRDTEASAISYNVVV
jgi:hypothetical protein